MVLAVGAGRAGLVKARRRLAQGVAYDGDQEIEVALAHAVEGFAGAGGTSPAEGDGEAEYPPFGRFP
jgi:hypothetical protein